MELNENQKKQIHTIIEKCKDIEYANANKMVLNAIKDWTEGIKNNKDAYNKIFKKAIKNEEHLMRRYNNLTDQKSLIILAELINDSIMQKSDFEELDKTIRKETLKIIGIKPNL